MRKILIGILCSLATCAWAQEVAEGEKLGDNLFIEAGIDMSLQKPHSYPASEMLSKGSSLGVDLAVGKWFTPELGLRTRVNWENGIIDSKSEWLAPFNKPGVNHEKGGYISVHGDIMLDVHNTVLGYDKDRRWNTQVFVRAGGVYNKGTDKGAPLIGAGIGNTFRVNDRWGVYLDVAYNGVSSGFTMDPSTATGTGSGQNMYFDVNLGVKYNIGRQGFGKSGHHNSIAEGSFWNGWFVQMGIDQTLYCPVEKDFSEVMSKGRSYGVDVAIGKRFSPVAAVRGKLNWENGLIETKGFEWVGYDKTQYESNHDGGGNVMMYFDGLLSMKHLVMAYEEDEKWDAYLVGRMGLSSNRSIGSLSPVVGIGAGASCKVSDRWSVFAESVYEGTTSEFFGGTSWSGPTGGAFNGIWDFNVGVQVEL